MNEDVYVLGPLDVIREGDFYRSVKEGWTRHWSTVPFSICGSNVNHFDGTIWEFGRKMFYPKINLSHLMEQE